MKDTSTLLWTKNWKKGGKWQAKWKIKVAEADASCTVTMVSRLDGLDKIKDRCVVLRW